MMTCKTCANCINRRWESWGGYDYCYGYEIATNDNELIENARECPRYEFEDPEDDEYCPSATAGDYSPSCPWNAPGMSIRDFI